MVKPRIQKGVWRVAVTNDIFKTKTLIQPDWYLVWKTLSRNFELKGNLTQKWNFHSR